MKAIIFNSGLNKRIGGDIPKCLLEFHEGKTFLGKQITQLSRCGIQDIIITTNPNNREAIESHTKFFPECNFTFVDNFDPEHSSNAISFMNVIEECVLGTEGIIVLHGDLLISDIMFTRALYQISNGYNFFGNRLRGEPWEFSDFKVSLTTDNYIKKISVKEYETRVSALIPMYYLNWSDWIKIVPELRKTSGDYLESVFNIDFQLKFFEFDSWNDWMEIDTVDNLQYARRNYNDFI